MECPSDEEEEEEDVIVYVNFEEGTVSKENFQQPDTIFKIVGLESDNPVVQLGETIFKGAWRDTIGTKLLFEEDPSASEPVDPVFTVIPPKMLKYKCMSTKTLELSRIFLKPKSTSQSESFSVSNENKDKVIIGSEENEEKKIIDSQEIEEKVIIDNQENEEMVITNSQENEEMVITNSQGNEVLTLVESTINPDESTNALMETILAQSEMDIVEGNHNENDNNEI